MCPNCCQNPVALVVPANYQFLSGQSTLFCGCGRCFCLPSSRIVKRFLCGKPPVFFFFWVLGSKGHGAFSDSSSLRCKVCNTFCTSPVAHFDRWVLAAIMQHIHILTHIHMLPRLSVCWCGPFGITHIAHCLLIYPKWKKF